MGIATSVPTTTVTINGDGNTFGYSSKTGQSATADIKNSESLNPALAFDADQYFSKYKRSLSVLLQDPNLQPIYNHKTWRRS
jgi:hypothetical protein